MSYITVCDGCGRQALVDVAAGGVPILPVGWRSEVWVEQGKSVQRIIHACSNVECVKQAGIGRKMVPRDSEKDQPAKMVLVDRAPAEKRKPGE